MSMRERRTCERPADGSPRGRWSQTQNGVYGTVRYGRVASLARAEKNESFARLAQCAPQRIKSRAAGARRYVHAGRTSHVLFVGLVYHACGK